MRKSFVCGDARTITSNPLQKSTSHNSLPICLRALAAGAHKFHFVSRLSSITLEIDVFWLGENALQNVCTECDKTVYMSIAMVTHGNVCTPLLDSTQFVANLSAHTRSGCTKISLFQPPLEHIGHLCSSVGGHCNLGTCLLASEINM